MNCVETRSENASFRLSMMKRVEEEHTRENVRTRDPPHIAAFTPLQLPSPEPTQQNDYKLQVAPEFTAKLKNKRVPEGLSLHMHCSVTGLPEPCVRWLKDGLEIKAGMGYSVKNNYGMLSLEVARVRSNHGGIYTCEAYNAYGTVSCDATVTIEGDEAVKTIEVEILRPRFLKPLQDLVVQEGEDLVMLCLATGKPMPVIKWQKDMLDLTPSSNHVTVTSDREGGSTLTIRGVKASDAGLYMVQAKSRSGRCQSSATVRVQGGSGRRTPQSQSSRQSNSRYCFSSSIQPNPKLETPASFSFLLPPSLEVHEGESLKLDCSVQGYPVPIVSWFKNYRGLRYDRRRRVLFVGSLHTLHIPQTMALDGGEYIVRAHNHLGTVESACTVTLLPPRPSPGDDSEAKAPVTKAPQRIISGEESEENTEAPKFTKSLPSTVEVSEGQNFRLDCVTRDGIDLVPFTENGGDTGQQQPRSPQGDTGQQAQDHSGHHSPQEASEVDTDTQAAQSVKKKAGEQPEPPSPPSFREPLPERMEVGEGERVSLTCKVSQAFARITWYKDDNRLSFKSQRMGSLREEGGRVSLRVDEVLLSDAGLYRCVASLSDGTQLQSETRLSVHGKGQVRCGPTYAGLILGGDRRGPTSANNGGESQVKNDTRQPTTTSTAEEMASSSEDQDTAPVLTVLHERHVVEEGQRAKLKVKVEGASSPSTVSWSREGKPVEASSKYKIYEEDGAQCLEVCDVSSDDRGTYVATASSKAGTATASAVLEISEQQQPDGSNAKTDAASPPQPPPPPPPPPPSTPPPPQPPALLTSLHDMNVVIGDRNVKLKCEVDIEVVTDKEESPRWRVSWYHEGEELREAEEGDKGYRRTWKGRLATLVIRQVTLEHAGVYRCEVSSAQGQVTTATSCTISVGEPEKMEPPFFIKELHDMEVEDGDNLELVVEVEDTDLDTATES